MRIFSFLFGFVNPQIYALQLHSECWRLWNPVQTERPQVGGWTAFQSRASLFEPEATVCQTDTYQLAMSISVSLQMVIFLSCCLPSILGQEDCCSFTIFVLF